jgi:hypothetical protein
MGEKVQINDPTDWAIIQSFYLAEKHILMLKKIVSVVRESSDKKDKAIEARIRKLVEKNYLVKCGVTSEKDRISEEDSKVKRNPGLYGLNERLEFEYTGIPANIRTASAEVPDEIRRNHTTDLKEAIKIWLKYIPEPKYNIHPSGNLQPRPVIDADVNANNLATNPYDADITMSEQHILFSDLNNHLPGIGCDAYAMWEIYKKELTSLNELQEKLLELTAAEIEKWLSRNVFFYKIEFHGSEKIGYNFAAIIIPLLMKYVKGDRSEVEFLLCTIPSNLCLKMRLLSPKLLQECINSPRRDQFREELTTFAMIVEWITGKKMIMKSIENILAKIDDLSQKKSIIIKELGAALLYSSFPGDCQYLR